MKLGLPSNKKNYFPWGLFVAPVLAIAGLPFISGGVWSFVFFALTLLIAPFSLLYGLSAWLCKREDTIGKIAFIVRRIMQGSVLVGLSLCFAAQIFIVSHSNGSENQDADILIVMGAGLRDGYTPSGMLAARLDTAADIMEQCRDIKVIVTGGLGDNAFVTEGEAMYAYLVERGIDSWRILVENQSTTTGENIRFSAEFLDGEGRIGIITNGFHLYRAGFLARRAGYDDVALIPAPSIGRTQRRLMRIRETGSVIFAWLGRK